MDKIVVLSWCQYSISFRMKVIHVKIGEAVTLGRAHSKEVSRHNGLFDFSSDAKPCKVSRNHAQITNRNSKIYLTTRKSNTFVNNLLLRKSAITKLKTGDIVILGGLEKKQVGDTAICLVRLFNPNDEEWKYFRLLEEEFPFYCRLPESPPTLLMSLEELYSVTLDRLQVLKDLNGFGENELSSSVSVPLVARILKSKHYSEMLMLENYHQNCQKLFEFMKRDHVSQYILALTCSRTNRLKHWFVQQERKLFILRWFKMFSQEKLDFLRENSFVYCEVTKAELDSLRSEHPSFFSPALKYFKVPYSDAAALMKKRRVYIEGGFCYLSVEAMFAPAVERLNKILCKIIKAIKRNLHRVWGDGRIASVVRFIESNVLITDRYQPSGGCTVSEKEVSKLCDQSFPLCMKILQYRLVRDHHLRNSGRFQYTLFLKAIGLSLHSSLCFWKSHFTVKMSESQFFKDYSYHIRHAYGIEGKMADYPPQSCAEILKAVPGAFEYHGCPFKLLDEERLSEMLCRSGINTHDHGQIFEHVRTGIPQLACGKYFKLTHGESYPTPAVEHPNVYYEQSRKVRARWKEREKVRIIEKDREEKPRLTVTGASSCQCEALDW